MKKAFSVNPVKELTGALTGATGGLSSFVGKVSALSALAAGGFGLGKLISGAVEGGENIYQLSTKMGITAAEASNLNKILKLTGSDTDSFAAAMTKLDKSYSTSGEAGDKVRGVLSTFGVSLSDSTGKLLPLNQQLAELSKGYKIAAENGLEQEYIMSTLGVKGLSLVQTLKDYNEASEMAAKSKGVGIDPKQMHELDKEMKIVSMQAGALGSAFTGALAPIAQETFPPIMEGLSSTAKFLAEHKSAIGSTVTTLVGLTAAYKTVGAASAIIAGIGNAWSLASAQAIAASTTTATATSVLTIGQERSISRMVANSNKEYAKMEAAAIKAATASAGSTEAASIVIAEKIAQIAAEAQVAAQKIRVNMTAAFAAQAEAATASAVVVSEALATQGAAATLTGTRTVAAAEAANVATASSVALQGELAAAHAITGNAAVVQGERTVGAMAVAKVGAGNFLSSLWALAGGWVGVAVATGYAISKLAEYLDAKGKVESYNPKAEVYEEEDGTITKKRKTEKPEYDVMGNRINGEYERVALSPAELEEHNANKAWREKQANQKPWLEQTTDPDILAKMKEALAGKDTEGLKAAKEAAKEAGQVAKEQSDYEVSIAKNKSKLLLDEIKSEQDALERERKGGLSGIRQYWASLEKEDSDGLAVIKEYWDKRTSLETKGINAELDALNDEKAALLKEMAATSDQSDSIKLKKQLLELTTSIVLKERELGEVLKKNTAAANENSVGFITKYAALLHDIKNTMEDINTSNILSGLKGSNKGYAEIENEKKGRLKAVQDVINGWRRGTAEIKDEYGVTITDSVGLDKWRSQQIDMINKQTADKRRAYLLEGKAFEDDLNQARNEGNLATFIETLNSEKGALAKNLTDRQLVIDTYNEAWRASHKSTTEYMIEGINGMASGLTTFFADAISGTSSIGDAWNALGSTVNNMISNMVAEWITGRIKMWAIEKIFGKSGDDATNKGITQGATTAAAWWPAAVAVSLATFGANAGPAIGGMTAASLVGMGLGSYATGGPIIGPGTGTSDSILSWLSNGEYVIKASAVKALGIDALNTLNTGRMPGFATGGLVTGRSLSSVSSSRYANASLAGNKLISSENKSTSDKSAGDQYQFIISGNDGPSIRKMIMEEGATIVKSLKKQAQGFNTAGVRAT